MSGFLYQRGHGVDYDGFGFFYDSQSFVVLSLFFSPFLVSEGFVGIQFVDFFSDQISEFNFSVFLDLFLISYGDFLSQFSGQFFDSFSGSFDFGFQISQISITFVLDNPNLFIIVTLSLSQISFGRLQHSNQILDWSFSL